MGTSVREGFAMGRAVARDDPLLEEGGYAMRYGTMAAALAAILLNAQSAAAQDRGALWANTPKSMSDHISEGWKISSHSADEFSNGRDYSFVLSRDNKSVICFVWVPVKKAAESHCRLLN